MSAFLSPSIRHVEPVASLETDFVIRHYGRSAPVRAFTLIELLTVIAIIGILAAIIIPVVGKVRRSGMNAQTVANLRQVHAAFLLYANDHAHRFPLNWQAAIPDLGLPQGNWKSSLATGGYLGAPDHPDPALTAIGQAGGPYSVLGSPAQRSASPVPRRYDTFGANVNAIGWASGTGGGINDQLSRLTDFHAPSRTLLLGEGALNPAVPEFALEITPAKPPTHTNDGKAALVFMDGHVERRAIAALPAAVGAKGTDSWYFWRGKD